MATSFSGTLEVVLSATLTDTDNTLNTIKETLRTGVGSFTELSKTLSNGTGSNQAKNSWYQRRTVNATTDDDIDLTSLTDRRGQSLTFAKVKWILIRLVSPATTVKLVVGGGTNPLALFADATDKLNVWDWLILTSPIDGWTVTNGAADILRINNPGGSSVQYDIVIVGTV